MARWSGLAAKMSGAGDCYDNAAIESFWSNLKKELIFHCQFETLEEARLAIFDYIEIFYNRKRIHTTLGDVSPAQLRHRLPSNVSHNHVPSGSTGDGVYQFVLINAACSSATFQFVQVCKNEQLATLVGQSTGGNHRGINGGAFLFCRLPNWKIEFDLPLIAGVPVGTPPDAGIDPDIVIAPSLADIAIGVETELQAVMKLIREGK